MQVTVLAGGIGAARFLGGLVETLASTPEDPSITVIGNTGDDIRLFGLQVCPDLDSVMYTLGGGASEERGWGREDETFTVLEELRAYDAMPEWFGLGDRDLATHILRTQMLNGGYPLSDVTAALCARWKLPVRLLPMTNDRVETHVVIDDPQSQSRSAIHFQEWWVRHRAEVPAQEFLFIGANEALPGPGVLEAIKDADLVILPPSNPVVSIGPILAVPGIRNALVTTKAPIVGISPIVGDAPVRGMAHKCLEAINVRTSAAGVGAHYGARSDGGLLDAWIIDSLDAATAGAVTELGMHCETMNTLFDEPGTARTVAARAVEFAKEL